MVKCGIDLYDGPHRRSLRIALLFLIKIDGDSMKFSSNGQRGVSGLVTQFGVLLRWLALAFVLFGSINPALAAKTYTDNGDGTVTDPTTGLTWMRCSMGQTWDGVNSTCTGTASTHTFDQANALTGTVTFAGQSDWRLPNIRELQTIVDRSRYLPTIDIVAFPGTPTSSAYWTSSTSAADPVNGVWSVGFDWGSAGTGYRGSYVLKSVRLVRGGQPLGLLDINRPTSDYVISVDGTVTHTPTGLTWQRCAVGQSWNGSDCTGVAITTTWDSAKQFTSNFAGKTDWRLPTVEELTSLIDFKKSLPAINSIPFPNTPQTSIFWTSSAYAGGPTHAWVVAIGHGYTNNDSSIFGDFIVRLVRGGRSFGAFTLDVQKSGTGQIYGGTLPGIECGAVCLGGFNFGDVVTLAANPAVNLLSWGGACANAGTAATCSVTMDAAKTVTATFKDTGLVTGLPSALAFASQNIASTSAAQTVTLTNTGTAALNISSIATSGDFAVSNNCGAGIGAGGSCTLDVTFKPTASGARTGKVTLATDAPGSPHTISLSGNGQGALASLSATSKTFASQNQGTTSAAQAITLTNIGGAVLNISSIAVTGDFANTTTCGTTLAPAASCSISVTFKPTTVGALSGSVVITSDASNSPNTITLTGTGSTAPVVSLAAAELSFSAQTFGSTSPAQTIKLTNTGAAALALSSISATGDFAVTNNCGSGLGAGGFCNLSVTFTPTFEGNRTGAVTITSNAPGSPKTLSLTGTGVAVAATPPANVSAIAGAGQATMGAIQTDVVN